MRIALFGLYRSGSSVLAAALENLGVDMGAPFFANHYECLEVAEMLRQWWKEPEIVEQVSKSKRIAALSNWANSHEKQGAKLIGLKHPLLAANPNDIEESWGVNTQFIWADRQIRVMPGPTSEAEQFSRL